jgi:hypothetical protein
VIWDHFLQSDEGDSLYFQFKAGRSALKNPRRWVVPAIMASLNAEEFQAVTIAFFPYSRAIAAFGKNSELLFILRGVSL